MKYINLIKIIIIAILIGISCLLVYKNNNLRKSLDISISNEKAYCVDNQNLKDKSREYKLTIDQLKYNNDSIYNEFFKIKDSLKIKDKRVKQLAYLLSISKRTDTIIFKDTIFKDPNLNIDTLIYDNWYNLNLKLKYPNEVITKPTFISEKYIITSYKKEPINPPKKLFFLRWIQKKHKIVEVEVIEKNPYIKGEKQRFIEVIK